MMKRVFVCLLLSTSALAGEVSVSVGAVGALNKAFGELTPTGFRFHDERGATLGIEWYLWRGVSVSAWGADIHEHVRYNGERTGEIRSVPTSIMFQVHTAEATFRPYIGAGVSYLMYRNLERSPFGMPEQPDHAAAIIGGGVDYSFSSRWALNFDVKYGPARSTAEVAVPGGPVQHIDFHQMYRSLGIRCRW
jgi:outer membrane protein W